MNIFIIVNGALMQCQRFVGRVEKQLSMEIYLLVRFLQVRYITTGFALTMGSMWLAFSSSIRLL
jgi:hypothetical protein